MPAELIRSTELFPGVPYAYAARAAGTGLIFTAGACPLDGAGQVAAPGDVAGQMRQALGNLRVALQDSGAGLRDVIKTTVYVASGDRQDLVSAWDAVAEFFGDHDPPSTLLGVAVLGYPSQLVEIEAVAFTTPDQQLRLAASGFRGVSASGQRPQPAPLAAMSMRYVIGSE